MALLLSKSSNLSFRHAHTHTHLFLPPASVYTCRFLLLTEQTVSCVWSQLPLVAPRTTSLQPSPVMNPECYLNSAGSHGCVLFRRLLGHRVAIFTLDCFPQTCTRLCPALSCTAAVRCVPPASPPTLTSPLVGWTACRGGELFSRIHRHSVMCQLRIDTEIPTPTAAAASCSCCTAKLH